MVNRMRIRGSYAFTNFTTNFAVLFTMPRQLCKVPAMRALRFLPGNYSVTGACLRQATGLRPLVSVAPCRHAAGGAALSDVDSPARLLLS